ncbi:MAG: 50S ribosomal protein L11 methyltransferase [Gemmatimonadales bacterium]|nr:50S ribosomal protein L11 methyltransferase [Gemmatimonadales bacterium]
MSWVALDIQTIPPRREAVAAWLVAETGQAVEERDDGTIVSFAHSEAAAHALLGRMRRELPETRLEVTLRELPETDWRTAWRDGIVTRRFGRLVLTPSWLPVTPAAGEVVLVIDPENAFGSGEHGSTRASLALLERHLRPGDRVLDLGSGSGILAIAALLLGARRAVGIEHDAESNPVAERNAGVNGVAARATFLDGEIDDLAPLVGPAELICSNILRTVNTAVLPAIRAALAPGGIVLFAGMEEQEAPLFRATLAGDGWTVVDEAIDGAWWACAARRAG